MQQQLEHQALDFFQQSFASFYQHSIAVDTASRVTWISDSYQTFLALDRSPVGRLITEILPNSFMPRVVSSGTPVLLDMLNINGQWVVVSSFPLKDKSGQISGAFGFVAVDQMQRIKPLLERYAPLQLQLKKAQQELHASRRARYTLSQCIGNSVSMKRLKQQVAQAAGYDLAVMLQGETGTGKELFAQALHNLSLRSNGPFVSVNVAAIPEGLLEAEFFGVSPGAYTGADRKGREGKFKLAQGGTLFLDEIGDMSLELQSKLLRVIEEKEFESLGSNRLQTADVRIIAATCQSLEELVAAKKFRPDLYYRLTTLPLNLPPLRERLDDLPNLCERLLDEIVISHNGHYRQLSIDALELLGHYHWPGNVRELKNVLQRACVATDDEVIEPALIRQVLPHFEAGDMASSSRRHQLNLAHHSLPSLAQTMQKAEREAILSALGSTSNHKSKTAQVLGISRASLYEKMRRLGIQ